MVMSNSGQLSDFEFSWTVRIYYEDTDAGGVVYYANYLKFMERARTEYLRHCGFEQDELRAELGIVFAVSKFTIHYDKPAVFNDELKIKTCITKLGKASIHFRQNVFHKNSGQAVCHAQVTIACLNAEKFTALAIPDKIITTIKSVIA